MVKRLRQKTSESDPPLPPETPPFVLVAPQTGSGKSYTMMGAGGGLDGSVPPEDHGLIPRICSGIFERIYQAKAKVHLGFGVSRSTWMQVTPAGTH